MTPTEKYLMPHGIFENKTFDEHCAKIPEFYFRKEVPEDVIKNFEIVEQLLAHRYYEYRFIDEALAKALHTFEMAMRIRYREIYPNSKKVMFNALITELSQHNLFETNFETLKAVKDLRNYYSHPERHSFGGVLQWSKLKFISRLINEMYENVPLRLERADRTLKFREELKKRDLEKNIVIEIEAEKHILHKLRFLFINNKYNPPTYLLACTPLFNLLENNGTILTPHIFKAKISNVNFDNAKLNGTSFLANQNIKFGSIKEYPELQDKFQKWQNEYSQKSEHTKFMYENANYYINEILSPEIEEFQRMDSI